MDLTSITEDSFLCDHALTRTCPNPLGFELGRSQLQGSSFFPIRSLGQGCALWRPAGQTTDVALFDGAELVGFYLSEALEIRDTHRGQKLSVPMILEAVKGRPLPTSRTVSDGGEAALRKAWRVANGLEQNPWLLLTTRR